MSVYPKYTSSDLESLPDVEGARYEIIDGDLFVSKQPSWDHQFAANAISGALYAWSQATRLGWPVQAPGLVFTDDNDVAPDVVWVSNERLADGMDAAGHLLVAPDLAVEVLWPGSANQRRDREFKLKLYSRQGVREYWMVDCLLHRVQMYRRGDLALELVATALDGDVLSSPMLPGFSLSANALWWPPQP